MTPTMPQEIMDRIALRVAKDRGKNRRVWVEQRADGQWKIHSNLPHTADRLIAAALQAGHPVYSAGFTTA